MKIDAYSEQKKAAAAYDEQQKRAAQIKGTVSGAALTQAVTFTKSDGKMELFAASSYESEAASADKKPKSGEEIADEEQALLDNMKAICNKMDTGEIVAMDEDGVTDQNGNKYYWTWTAPDDTSGEVRDPYDLYSWDPGTNSYIPFQAAESDCSPIGRGNGWYYYDEDSGEYVPW